MINQNIKSFFLYVFPISVGLTTYLWEQAFGALVLIPGLALAGTGIITVCFWIIERFQRGPAIAVWGGGDDTPKRLRPKEVLRNLKREDELIIVARTCKRWLFAENEKGQEELHCRLIEAIERGARVVFVLQDLRVGLANFTEVERADLLSDQKKAMGQFHAARKKIRKNKANLISKFRSTEVTNSMVIHTRSGEFVRLVQDISMGFKEKAFVEINEKGPILELLEWADDMVTQAMDERSYAVESGLEEINSLIKNCSDHLPLRSNESSLLLHDGASSYVAHKQKSEIPPPISVQLELTNECKTVCKMCTHYLLGADKGELDKQEIYRTLEWLDELGTRNIILSGGEPLTHKDISWILDSAARFRMHVGLLSSGVLNTGVIENELADKIADVQAWVQVSIDSFNKEKYRKIRSADLEVCLGTVKRLSDRGIPTQVCYTIQKDNVDEVLSGDVFSAYKNMLPQSVSVRFKFAHGYNGDFLVPEEQLSNVVVQLSARTNDRYIEEMLAKGFFTYDGIGQGLPTKEKIQQYTTYDFTCNALDLTLFIDSNGDVYPCCYLFDDNVEKSLYRSKYKLGSLRNAASLMVPSISDTEINPIKQIWNSEKLRDLRATKLPIEHYACWKCTRHIHQNEFLNRLRRIFVEYEGREINLAQEVLSRTSIKKSRTWV